MQINSSRAIDSYGPVTVSSSARLPVLYQDNAAALPVLVEEGRSSSQTIIPLEPLDNGQYARFIRQFASVERDTEHVTAPAIPRSVKMYLAVDRLIHERQQDVDVKGRTLDAMA